MRFNEHEYNSIKNELAERIQIINSSNFTMITIVMAVWSIVLSIFAEMATSAATMTNSVINLIFSIVIQFVFVLPLFVLVPISLKSFDNVRQLVNLAMYVRAFYEAPCVVKKDKTFVGWETIHYDGLNVPRSKIINAEYFIMGLSSLFLLLVAGITFCILFYNNALFLAVNIALFVILLIVAIISLVKIYNYGNANNIFKKYAPMYLSQYLNQSVVQGILTAEEKDSYIKYMDELDKVYNKTDL